MCGFRKYLIQAGIFFFLYALVDLLICKNFDFGNLFLATILYAVLTWVLDKLF